MNDLIIFTLVFTAPLIIFCIICFAKGVSQTKKITALTAVNLIAIYTALSLSNATHSSFAACFSFCHWSAYLFFLFCFYQFPFRAKKKATQAHVANLGWIFMIVITVLTLIGAGFCSHYA